MSKRILVVDEDPTVLVIFKKVLDRAGYRVHACGSAPEALSKLALAKFDLVVVDKNLPGITGFDLLALMRRDNPDLPAIMVTAYPEPNFVPTARLQGYLSKPFESLQLITETVATVLGLGLGELQRPRRRRSGQFAALVPSATTSQG